MNGIDGVLDTNIVIYLQKGALLESLPIGNYAISVITEIELLSSAHLDRDQITKLKEFLNDVVVIQLSDLIKTRTIELRLQHHLKVPDAIIAATAMVCDAVLFTNDRHFQSIEGVQLRSMSVA